MVEFKEERGGLTFAVHLIPRASRSEIAGEHNGAMRVRVTAPPVEGAANRELIRLLAKKFKVPQNAVEIVSGAGSRHKIIRVNGVTRAPLS